MGQNGAVETSLPPGWPEEVRPPGAPDWERTAVAWLFDLVPPDYRAHEVLRRYPALLARFAGDHVAAGLEAARAGWRTLRVELADQLPPEAIEAAMGPLFDAIEQREGLGDTVSALDTVVVPGLRRVLRRPSKGEKDSREHVFAVLFSVWSVSYTHLTLPTT